VPQGTWSVDFDEPGWVIDIINVVNILNENPTLHVTLKASLGVEESWAAHLVDPTPLGSGPKVYGRRDLTDVMDARARRVRDELVRWGISEDRIRLGWGEALPGAAGRKVEFIFDPK